jgi:primary-amine oxidase
MRPATLVSLSSITLFACSGTLHDLPPARSGPAAASTAPGEAPRHPLDPLSAAEIRATTEALAAARHTDSESRFPWITLVEPAKADVLAWSAGKPFARRALAVVKQGPRTFEGVVDVDAKKVVSWKEIEGVQPSILLEEFLAVTDIVKAAPAWQQAMRRRGYQSFDGIVCMPLSAGYYGVAEEDGRRLLRVPCFDGKGVKNYWGRPIEGVLALVDLNAKKVLKVIDGPVVPVPTAPADYDAESVGKLREAAAPIAAEMPRGTGYAITGQEVSWQSWHFHLRVDPRAGLVVSLVRYDDGGRLRSVLYEGHAAELFVPYMDPDVGWYFRTYMDMGEYGVGKLATSLVPGGDCPRYATFFGDVLADDRGAPVERPRIACLFERDAGDVAWRHYELLRDHTESRPARELVLRLVAAIGNYDYVFDWVFRQDGTIKIAVGATGIDEVKAVAARNAAEQGKEPADATGRFIAEHTVAVNHDHFFCYRLDLDVDGVDNSFFADRIETVKGKAKSLRKSWWVVRPQLLEHESEAKLHISMEKPALWRTVNPKLRGPGGYPVGFELRPGHSAMSLLDAADFPARRAGFARYSLWVTSYAADERWAAGDYPNQAKGGAGLPQWTSHDRRIDDRDIVLWYTLGFHHVVRPEDWPVLPTSWHEFELRPVNFFPRSPALDLPRPK